MDASVGLTFSLRLFQRYKRSGILQAEIRHMPGIQGACTAYIQLTTGSVTSCYLQNRKGQRFATTVEDLCRVDQERGPFAWAFHQQPAQSQSQPATGPSSPPQAVNSAPFFPEPDAAIPRAVAQLRWDQFNHWTLEQRLLLQEVWQSIDGQRTLRDIKASLPYSPQAINDILQILLNLRIIILAQ